MIISTYEFFVYNDFQDYNAKYPMINNAPFAMALQADDGFFYANVGINRATGRLFIEIFNENQDLIQPRFPVAEGLNLFYKIGYFLEWKPSENLFVWGKED